MAKYVSIYDDVIRRISAVIGFKPIIYLVSEEEDVIEDIFMRASCFNFRRVVEGEEKSKVVTVPYDPQEFGNRFYGKSTNVNVYTAYKSTGEPISFSSRSAASSASSSDQIAKLLNAGDEYFVARNFHMLAKNDIEDRRSEMLKGFVSYLGTCGHWPYNKHLFLIAPLNVLPDGFSKYVEIINVPGVRELEIAEMIIAEQQRCLKKETEKLCVEEYLEKSDDYLTEFKGLNRSQIRSVLYRMRTKYGCVSGYGLSSSLIKKIYNDEFRSEIRKLIKAEKEQMAAQTGMISFIDTDNAIEPGGMDGLVEWINNAKKILLNPRRAEFFDVALPKGVLITGIPGSGKTATAKYSAKILDLPLLQFTFKSVLGSLVGESEAKLDRVLKIIEAASPLVLWIDEIEKEFGGMNGNNEGGSVDRRLLARMLNWMQENGERRCFICATANGIGSLPSELLRRGRFDRNYYTFLPMHEQCVDIFVKQMNGVLGRSPHLFDEKTEASLETLGNEIFDAIAEMPGKFFTGADIAGLIDEAKNKLYIDRIDDAVDYNHPPKEIYSYDDFKDALLWAARMMKPYGESNFQKVLEYWYDLRENSFMNAALPTEVNESIADARGHAQKSATNDKKYDYMLFDFEDLLTTSETYKWREGLKCSSNHAYDQQMFKKLYQEIPKYKRRK